MTHSSRTVHRAWHTTLHGRVQVMTDPTTKIHKTEQCTKHGTPYKDNGYRALHALQWQYLQTLTYPTAFYGAYREWYTLGNCEQVDSLYIAWHTYQWQHLKAITSCNTVLTEHGMHKITVCTEHGIATLKMYTVSTTANYLQHVNITVCYNIPYESYIQQSS